MRKHLEITQEDARLLPNPNMYEQQQIEILKQSIRGKMRKSAKVQTHSKSHRRMQKKVGKV